MTRWREARDLRGRLAAVSWLRVGAFGAMVAAAVGAIIVWAATRPDAYDPPDPTARELELRREALQTASRTPPPGLVEANRSAVNP